MSTDLLSFSKEIMRGESIDFSIDVPLDYAVAEQGEAQESPLTDGSAFEVAFKADILAADAVLIFNSAYEDPPLLSLSNFDAPTSKLTLSFQASAERVRQVAPGLYVGAVIHIRPRPGPLGDQRTRVAQIVLAVIGG